MKIVCIQISSPLLGLRFTAALLPWLFSKNPRSYRKGATGSVRNGDQLLPFLCHCQLGLDIPMTHLTIFFSTGEKNSSCNFEFFQKLKIFNFSSSEDSAAFGSLICCWSVLQSSCSHQSGGQLSSAESLPHHYLLLPLLLYRTLQLSAFSCSKFFSRFLSPSEQHHQGLSMW